MARRPRQFELGFAGAPGDMAKKTKKRTEVGRADDGLPAAAVFSFLKEMSGEVSWGMRDLSAVLKIPTTEARRIAEIFQLQGYVKPDGKENWITTQSGQEVSGAKLPRYTLQHVEDSLKALRERIEEVNRERGGAFKVTQAIAFGDFLRERPRVQAADVGIATEQRGGSGRGAAPTARAGASQRQFLKKLRGRITALNLIPFQPWMAARSHRRLV